MMILGNLNAHSHEWKDEKIDIRGKVGRMGRIADDLVIVVVAKKENKLE